MKKLITLMLCITLFAGMANATSYFVDAVNGVDTNDGLSWATAVKTISAAETLAASNQPNNIYIKGSFSQSGAWTMTANNYYGSCAGLEATPTDRLMNDNDGNGIIESWEFKYPTTFTSTNNATAINGSAAILDGFTITQGNALTPAAVNGTTAMTTLISPIGQTVQNCVFYGSNLSYGATTAYTNNNGGCLLKILGTFQNNLIEKNSVSITYGAYTSGNDMKIAPILDVPCPSSVVTVGISGCIFRNNKVTLLNTGAVAAPTNLKGTILNVTANSPAATITISNCIIHNNEVNYTGSAGFPTAPRASIAGSLNFASSYTIDSYINCLFSNNKMTNLYSCMHVMSNTKVVHKVYNNAFWNNQNNAATISLTSSSAQIAATVISNNYLDGAAGGTWGTACTYTNNQTNLSKSNTGNNGSYFKKPPLSAGTNYIGSAITTADSTAIKQADWRLIPGSYLMGKGVTTTILKDKAGTDYSVTAPSVGAYEYVKITPVISWSQNLTTLNTNSNPLTVTLNGTSTADATYGSSIVYTPTDAGFVSIAGNVLTIVAKGSTTLTASQAANIWYNAATSVVQNVSVSDVPTAVIAPENATKLFTVASNGILLNTEGNIQIISFSGKMLQNSKVTEGQFIALRQGAYILRMTTTKGVFSQKIVL